MTQAMSQGDTDYTVLRNFHYKSWVSNDSVEHTIYRRILDQDPEKDYVRQASENLEWIRGIRHMLEKELGDYAHMLLGRSDSGGNNGITPESLEQGKLKILSEIDWFYRGNFYDRKHASAYPELAFTVSTRHYAGVVWYVVSYGVARGVKTNRHGTYSMFLTMEGVKDFLRKQVRHSGRLEHYKNHVNHELEKRSVSLGRQLTTIEKEEVTREFSAKASQLTNRYTSDANVEYVLHQLESCCDITTLPDSITRWMLRLAEKKLSEAIDHQEVQKRAQKLEDAENQELDPVVSITPTGQIKDSQGKRLDPLPAPDTSHETSMLISSILSGNDEDSDNKGETTSNPTQDSLDAPRGVQSVSGGVVDDMEETDLDSEDEEKVDTSDSEDEEKVDTSDSEDEEKVDILDDLTAGFPELKNGDNSPNLIEDPDFPTR